MYTANPRVDFLVCGDFNDPPDAESVRQHLHATGDVEAVRRAREPLLLDLFAGKPPDKFGTHYYHREWSIFDQIVVSPGMLDDAGWSADPASVKTINTLTRPGDRLGRPWRFGGEHDKGNLQRERAKASSHFASSPRHRQSSPQLGVFGDKG